MAALGFQALLFTLICWAMTREMRRYPEGSFFRPVLLGFMPILVMNITSFVAIQGMKPEEMTKTIEALSVWMSGIQSAALGPEAAKAMNQAEVQAAVDQWLKVGPGVTCAFWLGLLTLSAQMLRRWLSSRGQVKLAGPLSRWQAPDYMVWLLFIPGALLLMNQRGWLGNVEGWITALCQNVAIVIAAVFLFQGLMVLLEKSARAGLPKALSVIFLSTAMIMSLLPEARGIALGVVFLGILDTWFDFRKLAPEGGDSQRSS